MAHILIIDDEIGIRDTLAMIFEYEQHQVSTAESGIEGLRMANTSETPIDCILLDVKMPGMVAAIGMAEAVVNVWPW